MKICIVGAGYVGLSLSILLSQKNEVIIYDTDNEKVKKINNRISPIEDREIINYLKSRKLYLKATCNYKIAFENSDYIIICTPTNYDDKTNLFDTSSIEDTITKIKTVKKKSTIVIKSTVPIGYTKNIIEKEKNYKFIFSPEFLREGFALYDNLYPSRIIVGDKSKEAKDFANLLLSCSKNKNVPILYMNSNEAEAVKLFSNTYLAMRVAFFNELDTYALEKKLNTKDIIDGVSLDWRIGNYYNNPSFGYGGPCLPNDIKQLCSSYDFISQSLVEAIIKSNDVRKQYVAKHIIKGKPKIVGIYRLTMKNNSNDFRCSSIQDIIKILINNDIKVVIYEPKLDKNDYLGCSVIKDFKLFTKISDLILANRLDSIITTKTKKVFSRDIYNIN